MGVATVKTQNGYYINIGGKNYFIVQSSYYVKDKTLKRILSSCHQDYSNAALKQVRPLLKRAELGVDASGQRCVKLKGGSFVGVNDLIVINANSFSFGT